MATNTFERKIEIFDVESAKKLLDVISEKVAEEPLSKNPFSKEDRDRSEELLKQCLLRSPR